MEVGEKWLKIRVKGQEEYLKAFPNDEKATDQDPDYKSKDVSVWVNVKKPSVEDDSDSAKPRAQMARL